MSVSVLLFVQFTNDVARIENIDGSNRDVNTEDKLIVMITSSHNYRYNQKQC